MRRSSWSKARVPGWPTLARPISPRSEEHTSELQSQSNLVCRLLLEKKKIYNMVACWLIGQVHRRVLDPVAGNGAVRQQPPRPALRGGVEANLTTAVVE